MRIHEEELVELTPRIWSLAAEHKDQEKSIQESCFLQTLLKGSFSLLGVKNPKCALKVSACNIHIFFKIFDQVIKEDEEISKKGTVTTEEEKESLNQLSARFNF